MFVVTYPQAKAIETVLTEAAEACDKAGYPDWHAIASGAACLERLIHGNVPRDIAEISAGLKAVINDSQRISNHRHLLAIHMASTIIDGVRLGLLVIEKAPPAPWIGIDMGTGDRTVFGAHHA